MGPALKFKGDKNKFSRIGLDIGGGQIRLAQLKEEGGGVHLHEYGLHVLPDGVMMEGELKEPDKFANQLYHLMKRHKFAGDRVNLCIDHAGAHYRQIFLPPMPEKEMQNAIRFEAEKYTTAPLETYVIDYITLGEREMEGEKVQEIVLVMVPRRSVEDYLEGVSYAGFNPEAVEIAPFSLVRLMSRMLRRAPDMSSNCVVLELGAESSTLLVLEQGNYGFSRNLSVGSRHFWRIMAEATGTEEGKHMDDEFTPLYTDMKTFFEKKEFGSSMEYRQGSFHPQQVHEIAVNLSFQVRRSLDYYLYKLQREDSELQELYLCGEVAGINGLDTFLAEELDMEVEIIDPVSFLAREQEDSGRKIENSEILAVATGLAYRGWN